MILNKTLNTTNKKDKKSIEHKKSVQSTINYLFRKNFISDIVQDIKTIHFKNGNYDVYKQIVIRFLDKVIQYNYYVKYQNDNKILVCGRPFIRCLKVSKPKILITAQAS